MSLTRLHYVCWCCTRPPIIQACIILDIWSAIRQIFVLVESYGVLLKLCDISPAAHYIMNCLDLVTHSRLLSATLAHCSHLRRGPS